MRVSEFTGFIRLVAIGSCASIVLLTIFFIWTNGAVLRGFLLYEALPGYEFNYILAMNSQKNELRYVSNVNVDDTSNVFKETGDAIVSDAVFSNPATAEIVGMSSITFQPEHSEPSLPEFTETPMPTPYSTEDSVLSALDKLSDLAHLKSAFYTVESLTAMTKEDFDINTLIGTDLSLSSVVDGPKVIIFHTHMYEGFVGGNPDDIRDGVYGIGELTAKYLSDKYGIPVLHYGGRFDTTSDGKITVEGAYDRMEPEILKVLQKYPSIEVALDIHRDGLDNNVKLTADINGQTVAPIMFVNGLTKIVRDGALQSISSLPNPFLKENLAFSFQTQLAANELFPGFARKIYLKPYRYSTNMLAKSLLVEVGAQTNTTQEAFGAAEPLADIIAKVLLK